jgi:hypothetical protein
MLVKGDSMKDEQEVWYELKEYQVDGVLRKLFCRLATNKDVKEQGTTGHNSQYYKWEVNKKRVNNYVKRRAFQYISKDKKIKKENTTRVMKKEEEEDKESEEEVQEDNEATNPKMTPDS